MIEFTTMQWTMVITSAFIVGFSRSGVSGAGVLVVPIMALAMSGNEKLSVGLTLGLLCISDLGAIVYWRKTCQWRMLLKIIPPAFVGVAIGASFLDHIPTHIMMGSIGGICLAMMGMKLWLDKYKQEHTIPNKWWLAIIFGITGGAVSAMANAAGPLMVLYFLSMKYPKEKFIATSVWFFMLVNLFKLPFLQKIDLITASTIKTNAILIPIIALGLITGIKIVKYIPQKQFDQLILWLAAIGSVVLVIRSFY